MMEELVFEQAFKGRGYVDSQRRGIFLFLKETQNAQVLREAGDDTFGALREQLPEEWTDTVCT